MGDTFADKMKILMEEKKAQDNKRSETFISELKLLTEKYQVELLSLPRIENGVIVSDIHVRVKDQ